MLPTYASSFARHIVDTAARLGADRETVLSHAGLTWSDLQNPQHRVTQPQLLCLYQAAALLTDYPHMGLLVGEAVRPEGLHQLGYALMSCQTVGEALAVNLRFQALVMGPGQFDTQLSDDLVTLSWRPDGASPALLRPLNETILASWVRFGQWITGSPATPLRVAFCHARPPDIQSYHRVFQCPIDFDCTTNSLTGPRFLLELPLRQANPGLKQALLAAMEKELPLSPQAPLSRRHSNAEMDWVESVKLALLSTLDQPGAHLPRVAGMLHVSERTLKRQLQAKGTSLRTLLQDVRAEQALGQLASAEAPIHQLAAQLGYQSTSAFSQAFKRWQGSSPRTLRHRPPTPPTPDEATS